MVLPGFADTVDHQGYLIETCNECQQRSVFAVYEARRRLTISMFTTNVNLQQKWLMECRTCGAKFGVPKTWESGLPRRLMTQSQLSAHIRDLRGAAPAVMAQNRPQGPAGRTAYQVLQVDPSADQDVIEAAFKRLALKSHPDRHDGPEAADRMRELVAARDLLLTPERRFAYDRSIGIARPAAAYRPDPAPARSSSAEAARAAAAAEARRADPAGTRRSSQPPSQAQPSATKMRAADRPIERERRPAPPAEPQALPAPGPRPGGIRADEV